MAPRIHDMIRTVLETTPGLTQRGLAERMGLNPAAVNRMLYGRRNIMAEEIPVIESYLGRKLDIAPHADFAQGSVAPRRGFSDVPQQAPFVPETHAPVPVVSGGRTVDWAPRLPVQAGIDDAFAIYMDADDMAPRYFRGELIYVHPGRPAEAGRDVVIEKDGMMSVRRLLSFNGGILRVQRFSPLAEEDISASGVTRVYSIVGRG
jgi:transcriptional regulator with XRE-family HTH domain